MRLSPRSSVISRVYAGSASDWEQLKCDWSIGDKDFVERWSPSCVVRVAVGGVGGCRILGLTAEPVQWPAWSDMVRDRRNVRSLPIEFADVNGEAGNRLAQRAKSSSGIGEMDAFSSTRGARLPLPSVISAREAARRRESASVSAEV